MHFSEKKDRVARRTLSPTREHRRFARVECALRTEFRLRTHGLWLSADVLDLSVVGVKVRFSPFQEGRTLSSEIFKGAECMFRFPLKGGVFYLEGRFLNVYHRRIGLFTAGVEFLEPSPEEQFKLVELYVEFKRRNRPR